MNADIGAVAYLASDWILPILLAITFHEAAHGWVASRSGDPTAKSLSRVSFNTFKHIDLWGTVLIPRILLLTCA
ncbi:MAG: site-2 protease family protein, partial [Pseudomonadota bacterium]|nr:site-2 protease family protein [Pseudomonadota bacterium]